MVPEGWAQLAVEVRQEGHLANSTDRTGLRRPGRVYLTLCSLAFEHQPTQFPLERAKVAYIIISLLSGGTME